MRHIEELLFNHGLKFDKNVEYTVAIIEGDQIIATGSFEGRVIKCLVVDQKYRGMGLSNRIIGALMHEEYRRGNFHLFIFTKPQNQKYFQGIGFNKVAEVPDSVVLLENVSDGMQTYLHELSKTRRKGAIIGSIVVICDPFTLAHKYIIEKASKECDYLHVFVLSDDKSVFPFNTRFELIKKGIDQFQNVIMHQGGDYIIPNTTFPTYFFKDTLEAVKAHVLLTEKIFSEYIAPVLGINKRFVGEANDDFTDLYHTIIKKQLPSLGIEVEEISKYKVAGEAVSTFKVRELIKGGRLSEVKKLVPETTYDFLRSEEAKKFVCRV
ncbi:MAG: [citrate (pro-3S)-lyase] ligase [Bacillota bacterium]